MCILRLLPVVILTACVSVAQPPQQGVDSVLDAWHRAASEADESEYFGRLADDAVFLGTDATERWTREAFIADMSPYFQRSSAWTYTPVERSVSYSRDGQIAWFDERLMNESYGECRGSGVLRNEGGSWKIVQYNLTIPIPNAIAEDVVRQIREHEKGVSVD